jgi:hypothetical protein
MNAELFKTKSFWTGILGIVAVGAGFATGQIDAGTAIQTGVTSAMGIFLRNGMLKGGAVKAPEK